MTLSTTFLRNLGTFVLNAGQSAWIAHGIFGNLYVTLATGAAVGGAAMWNGWQSTTA